MKPRYRVVKVPSHPRAKAIGWVYEHIVVAEKALGRFLPLGSEVHHVDGDKRNNTPSNLVICQDREYHQLLHVRTRVVRAGGDPNTQRLCSHCKELKPFAAFNRAKADKSFGLQGQCRTCQSSYARDWYETNRQTQIDPVWPF